MRNDLTMKLAGIFVLLTIIVFEITILYSKSTITNDDASIEIVTKNQTDVNAKDIVQNTQEGIIAKIEYDTTLKSNTNVNVVKEGDIKYRTGNQNNYITIKNGVPTVVNNGVIYKSDFSNIKNIYYYEHDYNQQFAYLTNSGEVYVGWSILDLTDSTIPFATEELNKVEKVNSQNKYETIEGYVFDNQVSDDTSNMHFIGVTESGKRDLIKLNYVNK